MELTKVFEFVKSMLSSVVGLKLVTWWNGQQGESILHTTPSVFIEFSKPLNTVQMAGTQSAMSDIEITVLLVNKSFTNNAGEVNTINIAQHEALGIAIYKALQGASWEWETQSINSMQRRELDMNMNTPGMIITKQVFEAELVWSE